MNRIAVVGMAGNTAFLSVENLPAPGETAKARAVHFEPGGKGFNQAVAAARAGGEVSFLAAVGEDHAEEIAAFLEKDGIRATLVPKKGAGAYAAVVTDAAGANVVTVFQGPSLTPEDVFAFREEIGKADVLLLTNEVPEEVNAAAVKIAKDAGVFVILNPAPARELGAYLSENTDLFTPNEHETAGLEEKKNVVVTLGKEGCFARESGEKIPAFPVKKVVDTTGAGDTFNGVLARGIAAGVSLPEAIRAAVRAASVSTARPYAATAIPTAKETEDFTE